MKKIAQSLLILKKMVLDYKIEESKLLKTLNDFKLVQEEVNKK